jgi:hypothetical protein
MDLGPFIDRVCAEGIATANAAYSRPEDADRLRGAIEGFELCQGIEHTEHLLEALHKANARAIEAAVDQAPDHWRWSCRADRIEWVCNAVSAALVAHGLPSLGPLWPTSPAMLQAERLLGVKHGRVWRMRGWGVAGLRRQR